MVTNRPNVPRMKVKLKNFLFGTWNVQSLYRAEHLISELERHRQDIEAIQETRWSGNRNVKIGNQTFFYSGVTEHQSGVGFIVNDKILPNLKNLR